MVSTSIEIALLLLADWAAALSEQEVIGFFFADLYE